jgi:hypothetical protein
MFMGGAGYDADALLYFAQLTGTIPTSFKQAINTFIVTLKADGNWAELDRFWLHATPNQQNARISIVNPSSTPITEVNSPTFTPYSGYTSNGVNSYLNTNYNPNTQGVKYTLNNASGFAYSVQNIPDESGSILGNYTPINFGIAIYPRYLGLGLKAALYSNTDQLDYFTSTLVDPNYLGLYVGARTSNINTELFKNGLLIGSAILNSTLIPNNNMFVLCTNASNSPIFLTKCTISISGFGSGNINQATFYTAVQTLATSLGFNV